MHFPKTWFALVICSATLAHSSASADEGAVPAKVEVKQSTSEADKQSPLSERIAQIERAQNERYKQFHDQLQSIASDRKQMSDAEYGKKIAEANDNYGQSVTPAADDLIALIKANRADPDVVDGLIVLERNMSYSLTSDRALARIVLEDQLANPKIGALCFQLYRFHDDDISENILTTVAEKHPLREVRGQATYALGEYYRQTARDDWGGLAQTTRSPEQSSALLARAEKQFTDVLNNFADVKTPDGQGSLSDRAAAELARVKNIPILKPGNPAPQISGKDLDGQPIKLSDYRGKIVVMVYWGSWCGPCMAMVPEERELFARMNHKPFILLGINCGDPLEKAKETTEAKRMVWPSLWDGGATDGPIQAAYNVLHWPTVYVLDAKGTIRFFDVRGKELDAAVDELLAEMAEAGPAAGDAAANK
jgi:peroxiredoxin